MITVDANRFKRRTGKQGFRQWRSVGLLHGHGIALYGMHRSESARVAVWPSIGMHRGWGKGAVRPAGIPDETRSACSRCGPVAVETSAPPVWKLVSVARRTRQMARLGPNSTTA